MALTGYGRNGFGNVKLGDVSNMLIKVVADSVQTSQLAPESAPEVAVTSNAGGVYALTIPKSVAMFVDGCTVVGSTATLTSITYSPSAGTFGFTLSTGAKLVSPAEVHISLQLGAP